MVTKLGASLWPVAPPLAGAALNAVGSGLFYTLLPLRLVADGHGVDAVGLVVMAEGVGFLVGCLGSVRLIRSVGEVRAYAALAAFSSVLVLAIGVGAGLVAIMAIRTVAGFAGAGQLVVIESWLNALVSNDRRGRVLTLYVLVLGLFYGLGQLLARDIDAGGDKMLMITAAFYAVALVPVTAVRVGEPQLHAPVRPHLLKALRTSPLGALACLMTGLVSYTFAKIGPVYGLQLGFAQDRIAILMAATQLGALFLQFPIGYLSDRYDRRRMMLVLALGLTMVCFLFLFADKGTPFWLLLILFSLFGGVAEIFYPLGVAHANDRAASSDFVALSSNLLLIWALGGMLGAPIAAAGIERFGAESFFWYAIALSGAFAVFALWRSLKAPQIDEKEEFVAYPQTSPAVYEWAPRREAAASAKPTLPDEVRAGGAQ